MRFLAPIYNGEGKANFFIPCDKNHVTTKIAKKKVQPKIAIRIACLADA